MYRPWLLVAGLAASVLGCGKPPRPSAPPPPAVMASPWIAAGVRKPPARAAADAGLDDNTAVVGVVVGGKARAYSIPALSPVTSHIVNDVVGDVPVTVTYCDLCRCLRVFTQEGRHDPIELSQAGRNPDGLLVMYGGLMYSQATGERAYAQGEPLPLKSLPHEQTTWKAWREKHPDTEVYVGVAKAE